MCQYIWQWMASAIWRVLCGGSQRLTKRQSSRILLTTASGPHPSMSADPFYRTSELHHPCLQASDGWNVAAAATWHSLAQLQAYPSLMSDWWWFWERDIYEDKSGDHRQRYKGRSETLHHKTYSISVTVLQWYAYIWYPILCSQCLLFQLLGHCGSFCWQLLYGF